MSLSDWITAKPETSSPLSAKMLNDAMAAAKRRGSEPRHDCRYDGHIAHFCSERCVACRKLIRTLTPDENHLLLGEFEPPRAA